MAPTITNLFDARDHLRLDIEFPDEELERKLGAAELIASEFLCRKIYANQDTLIAAASAAAADLLAAGVVYAASVEAATAVQDLVAQQAASEVAARFYKDALLLAMETRSGIVVNPAIEAAIFLILGHLFENRQNVIASDGRAAALELPQGAYHLLYPYRRMMGV